MDPVKFKRVMPYAETPTRATEGSAGFDLYAVDRVDIGPSMRKDIRTGIAVQIPAGYEGQLRMRSGLARKGLMLLNGVGTIDSDYRGEIEAVVINASTCVISIRPHDRIAQLIIAPVAYPEWVEAELDVTTRGSGGFGSTGK